MEVNSVGLSARSQPVDAFSLTVRNPYVDEAAVTVRPTPHVDEFSITARPNSVSETAIKIQTTPCVQELSIQAKHGDVHETGFKVCPPHVDEFSITAQPNSVSETAIKVHTASAVEELSIQAKRDGVDETGFKVCPPHVDELSITAQPNAVSETAIKIQTTPCVEELSVRGKDDGVSETGFKVRPGEVDETAYKVRNAGDVSLPSSPTKKSHEENPSPRKLKRPPDIKNREIEPRSKQQLFKEGEIDSTGVKAKVDEKVSDVGTRLLTAPKPEEPAVNSLTMRVRPGPAEQGAIPFPFLLALFVLFNAIGHYLFRNEKGCRDTSAIGLAYDGIASLMNPRKALAPEGLQGYAHMLGAMRKEGDFGTQMMNYFYPVSNYGTAVR